MLAQVTGRGTNGHDDFRKKLSPAKIPAKIIWEDDDAIAFHDVNPQAPVHVLIVPKKIIPRLADARESDVKFSEKLLLGRRQTCKELGIEKSGLPGCDSQWVRTPAKACRICTFISCGNAHWLGRPG